ncbi:MAG: restriction endonuclease [Treponema sp.]|nr:restriction endonuclease [Treponema sp.]
MDKIIAYNEYLTINEEITASLDEINYYDKEFKLINSDDTILIQCKRRESKNKTEPVSAIKEFIGTLFIEERNKGIYVTTAKDFSKRTKKMIKKQLLKRKFERFELINYNDFVSMHNLVNKDDVKPWENILLKNYEYYAKKRIKIDKYDFYKKNYHIFKENIRYG